MSRTNDRAEHASLGIKRQISLSSNITFEHPGTLDRGSDCRSHRGDDFSPLRAPYRLEPAVADHHKPVFDRGVVSAGLVRPPLIGYLILNA